MCYYRAIPENEATPHPRDVHTAVNIHPCLTSLAGAELNDKVKQQAEVNKKPFAYSIHSGKVFKLSTLARVLARARARVMAKKNTLKVSSSLLQVAIMDFEE